MSVKSKPSTCLHRDGSKGWVTDVSGCALTRARIGAVLSTSIGDVAVLRLGLRVPFRGLDAREVVLWRGPVGWAEFSPFAEYADSRAVAWFRAMRAAGEHTFPAPRRTRVSVNATVPAVAAGRVHEVLALFPGCTTAKVKVAEAGQTMGDDLDRLAAVRDALGTSGRVRVDANGAWDLAEARSRLPRYDRAAGGLEYVEQPCAAADDLARLRRGVDVPVAADESIRLSDDPRAAAEAVDVVIVKVAPLGGVPAVLDLVAEIDRPVVVSSALDSSVGLAAGLALAAALPDLPFACGLGTAALLADDVSDEPLLQHDGSLTVRPVVVSEQRLADLAVGDDRARWWVERIERVAAAAA